jgi:hypothetical protein
MVNIQQKEGEAVAEQNKDRGGVSALHQQLVWEVMQKAQADM